MSWQLVSFALVALSLAVAFWSYERSHPPAKLVAVVATLAALAALGRDAFVAIPDVKPITAIVLVAGVAFGPGPGFAVGAIAALASNVMLGQGPWTPWQMLGWGIVGLLGGCLGSLAVRRLHPLAIAFACAAAAEVYNLVVDLYTWTGTGAHTLAGFGLVLAQASIFDATHVVASFLFALAFGTALLRMLTRVRSRLQVSWQPSAAEGAPAPTPVAAAGTASPLGSLLPAVALVLALPALLFGVPATARAGAPAGRPPQRARLAASGAVAARATLAPELSFLAGAQNSDGGFGGARGQASSELFSAWAAIGLAAGGRDPLSLRRGGHTVLDALRGEAGSLQGAGDLERTILALRACGVSVNSFPGGDPVARLLRLRSRDGSFGELANLTAFAILALRAAGEPAGSPVVQGARRWLVAQHDDDGGFGFAAAGGVSDVDDTAAVVQALVAAGTGPGSALGRATAFLLRAQNLDGGFPQQPGETSNAQSTAWAVQGLVAVGRAPASVTRSGSRSPLGYLESLIAPDGSVRYSRTSSQTPVWVTAQALTALAAKPFPVAPVAGAARPAAVAGGPAPGAARAVPARRSAAHARLPAADAYPVGAPRLQAMARALGALLGVALAPVSR
ncbi:MAG TPA: prenyltransferase/squalene oxidase repeat-containing protein [Solirubrobacteraceae bacterium]|nr:prenyltransferase/squalene oxidase repeat-containing protein [Solirubrobacteraceae bacterium]